MLDLTCFWEEDSRSAPGQYTFIYKYQNENSTACAVASQSAGGGRTRYFCKLSKVKHFVSLDLQVFQNGAPLHNRSLSIDLVFLLDPPANLTVRRTEQRGQLRLRWLPPSLKYMAESMMYEVRYALAGSPARKLEVVRGNTEFILRSLNAGTRYEVWVRAKPDGLTYNGYWSAWTPSVSMETPPSDLDPLVIGLCLVISLILTLLSLMAFLSHRRYLWKIWPVHIPSPENQFPGLFTVYGGDFLEWLGQSSGWLQLRPSLFYQEAMSGPLEVLSEASNGPLSPGLTLLPRASGMQQGVSEEEEEEDDGSVKLGSTSMERSKTPSYECWLMDQLQTLQKQPIPSPWPSLLQSQDAYVTLDQISQPGSRDGVPSPPLILDDVSEELHVLVAAPGNATSRSELGAPCQGFRSGRLSSHSGFEYPQNPWLSKGPGSPYLAVADSGVSMDYSPMSSSTTRSGGAGSLYATDQRELHCTILANFQSPLPSEYRAFSLTGGVGGGDARTGEVDLPSGPRLPGSAGKGAAPVPVEGTPYGEVAVEDGEDGIWSRQLAARVPLPAGVERDDDPTGSAGPAPLLQLPGEEGRRVGQ
ncbi:erythropoietin receptor-like isoform X2 [Conger conger]|nr:erythropoietin receptor-like isoform X2 [Conger conger]